MIRAICFDFAGTLARFRGDLNELSMRMNLQLGLEDFSPELLQKLSRTFRSFEYTPEPVTLASATIKTLAAHEITFKGNVLEICDAFIKDYGAQMQLLPNVLVTLNHFADLPKAIITNSPSDLLRAAIEAAKLEEYFQTILVSGDADVCIAKPNPRIFQIACERLGVEPRDILMIGDRLDMDVESAIGAGLQAIHKPEIK
jgi:HAD superfamily hydrolase (TIGR01549 family)